MKQRFSGRICIVLYARPCHRAAAAARGHLCVSRTPTRAQPAAAASVAALAYLLRAQRTSANAYALLLHVRRARRQHLRAAAGCAHILSSRSGGPCGETGWPRFLHDARRAHTCMPHIVNCAPACPPAAAWSGLSWKTPPPRCSGPPQRFHQMNHRKLLQQQQARRASQREPRHGAKEAGEGQAARAAVHSRAADSAPRPQNSMSTIPVWKGGRVGS